MKVLRLGSADDSPWTDPLSRSDGLPIRDSGSWIEEKHRVLVYFAQMFATGMKAKWPHRIYLELFSGPGKCLVRDSGKEELGSPLKVIDQEFTRFIFIDINTAAVAALERRLTGHANADRVEIWNGDCADVIGELDLPRDALTFAFIDPTGISHAPFELIRKLRQKTRCDLLINVQHGMAIKMNMHQYKPDADEDCALTRFLGNEDWKPFLGSTTNPAAFFQEYLKLYRAKLAAIGLTHSKNHVMVNMRRTVPLYLLLFASGHPLGQKFWDKAVSGSNPQSDFGFAV